MTFIFVLNLSLKIYDTDVRALKIHNYTFKIFKIVLVSFWIKDKFGKL